MAQDLASLNARSRTTLKRHVQGALRHRFPSLWHAYIYRRYLHADYGEREIHFLSEVVPADRYAIDIGVYEGVYTRRLAGLCRGVFGFEANPDSARFCKAALGKTVTMHNCALSDSAGLVNLRLPDTAAEAGAAALATVESSNDLGGRPAREIQVSAARLDDFDLPPIGFIKIDVEGHEEAVLRGAEATIARNRPALMIEIEERHNRGALGRIFADLRSQGFRAQCVLGNGLRDAPSVDDLTARAPDSPDYINNFFFIPEERSQELCAGRA
jgi:FkbM family methyltransferase